MPIVTAVATLAIGCMSAFASHNALSRELPLWELGGGLSAVSLPDYRGSNQSHGYLLPFPYVVYRGDKFRIDRQRVRGFWFESDRIELDLSANAAVPVRSVRNDARSGMPNLSPVWEIGPSLRFIAIQSADKRTELSVRLPVRAAIATDGRHVDGTGYTFSPTLGVDWRELTIAGTPNWNISALVSTLYATRAYHDYYYSVAPAFATANRSAYVARGGYGGWQLTGTVAKRWDKFWIGGFIRYDSVDGATFDSSPLVRTRANVVGGIAFSYIFLESATKVDSREPGF